MQYLTLYIHLYNILSNIYNTKILLPVRYLKNLRNLSFSKLPPPLEILETVSNCDLNLFMDAIETRVLS